MQLGVAVDVGHVRHIHLFAVFLLDLDLPRPLDIHVDGFAGDMIAVQGWRHVTLRRDGQAKTGDHFLGSRFALGENAVVPLDIDAHHGRGVLGQALSQVYFPGPMKQISPLCAASGRCDSYGSTGVFERLLECLDIGLETGLQIRHRGTVLRVRVGPGHPVLSALGLRHLLILPASACNPNTGTIAIVSEATVREATVREFCSRMLLPANFRNCTGRLSCRQPKKTHCLSVPPHPMSLPVRGLTSIAARRPT